MVNKERFAANFYISYLKVLFHVDAPLINLSPMIMEHIVTLLEVPVLHAQVA
jgi:hypothetical protein